MPYWGFEEFGLDENRARALGSAPVTLRVLLKPTENLKPLLRFPPAERGKVLCKRKVARMRRVLRTWPKCEKELEGENDCPSGFKCVVPASQLPRLDQFPDIDFVEVLSVGRRARRPKPIKFEPRWYGIRARVAVQVEGKTRGSQTVEDLVYVIKATSEESARSKFTKEYTVKSALYLNEEGSAVRWVLDEILDVYEVIDSELSENGTEVYSKLSERRLKPEFVWPQHFRTRK